MSFQRRNNLILRYTEEKITPGAGRIISGPGLAFKNFEAGVIIHCRIEWKKFSE